MNVLALDHVVKRFGDFTAVDDLSFRVPEGGIFGFLGGNGAGKTTSLRMALDIIRPTQGQITVLGRAPGRENDALIGFLPEERGLYRRMGVLDTVIYFGRLKGMSASAARKASEALIDKLGLGAWAGQTVDRLSKGMSQKVQLATALVNAPRLLILDEPFSGLDPVNQGVLEDLIRESARGGATVVFSTHVMQHAERLCDQVVLLAAGRKVFDGSVEAARKVAPRSVVLEGAFEADALSGLPGLGGLVVERLDGGALRIVAALDPSIPAQIVLGAVFAKGLPIDRFELREPNLHEAFILLTASRAGVRGGS